MLARKYANYEIKREQKHLKAYLRGRKFYNFYGRQLPVLTPETFAQQKHMQEQAELDVKKHRSNEEEE